jgi:Domain of unknown function (DUF3846)
MSQGRLLVIEPFQPERIIDWKDDTVGMEEPPLSLLQGLVGGYIEAIDVVYQGRTCPAYFAEEGALRNLPPNREASRICGFAVVGIVVVNITEG